jgi:hypothetical protein
MMPCYQLEFRALSLAIVVIAVITGHFLWSRPARVRA